jgi:hypothetical protein
MGNSWKDVLDVREGWGLIIHEERSWIAFGVRREGVRVLCDANICIFCLNKKCRLRWESLVTAFIGRKTRWGGGELSVETNQESSFLRTSIEVWWYFSSLIYRISRRYMHRLPYLFQLGLFWVAISFSHTLLTTVTKKGNFLVAQLYHCTRLVSPRHLSTDFEYILLAPTIRFQIRYFERNFTTWTSLHSLWAAWGPQAPDEKQRDAVQGRSDTVPLPGLRQQHLIAPVSSHSSLKVKFFCSYFTFNGVN